MGIKRETGNYITASTVGEAYKAFIPLPLPPVPPVELDDNLSDLLEKANRSLGRLDGLSAILPDIYLFLYHYIRKEALLSSQIEGTQSSFSDLLLFERGSKPGVPVNEVQEVSNYVAAMEHGLARLRDGFPLSIRLFREIHAILLQKGRGSTRTPGEFRNSQNWIGGSRPGNALFVPPPAHEVITCMGDLENFLHDRPSRTPVLIKAALAHVQFETIHPFLDGNGRLGRLLITFLLCAEGALAEPLLYLSLFFKTHRTTYYDLLQSVRETGEWENWLEFFLTGVKETADQATSMARTILQLFEDDARRIQSLGKAAGSALKVHQAIKRNPIVSSVEAATNTGLTPPTARAAISNLQKLGILTEITGKQRDRLFSYHRYLDLLREGTELL